MSLPPRRARSLSLALVLALLAGCGGLAGTYEATQPDGTMTLEFKRGGKVVLTMQQPGAQPDVTSGDFLIDGNKVTVQIPGGMPLVLVRNGKTLEANMMGQIQHFEKK